MEHLIDHYYTGEEANLKGFVFGFIHIGITILGYYTGLGINKLLKFMTNGYVAGFFWSSFISNYCRYDRKFYRSTCKKYVVRHLNRRDDSFITFSYTGKIF